MKQKSTTVEPRNSDSYRQQAKSHFFEERQCWYSGVNMVLSTRAENPICPR